MPDGVKHVMFSGFLRDVPLASDYLGIICESRQQIEIVSFEYLDSVVNVPAAFDLAVSGTAPLEFAHGVEEGYYLLNFKQPATFHTEVNEEHVEDNIDDGDIMYVDRDEQPLEKMTYSEFDKDIFGVGSSTSKVSQPITSKKAGKQPMSNPEQAPYQRQQQQPSSPAVPFLPSQTAQPQTLTTGSKKAGKQLVRNLESLAIGSKKAAKQKQASFTTDKKRQSSKWPTMSSEKVIATTSLSHNAVVVEEASSGSSISSELADYEGFLDLKRVRTNDTAATKKPKKKTRSDAIKYIESLSKKL